MSSLSDDFRCPMKLANSTKCSTFNGNCVFRTIQRFWCIAYLAVHCVNDLDDHNVVAHIQFVELINYLVMHW